MSTFPEQASWARQQERLFLSEPLLALAIGAAVERALPLPRRLPELVVEGQGAWQEVVREASRTIIAIQVFTTAIELPKGYFMKVYNLLAVACALGPIGATSWAIIFVLTYSIMAIRPLPSLAIAACLTPTDPIIIHAVVKGAFAEYILPSRLRNLLSAESGLNDGTALPFLMLPLVLMEGASSSWKAGEYLGVVIAWECIAGSMFGMVLGWLSGRLLGWSLRHALMEHDSLLAYTYVLSIATLGGAQLLQMNGILACFFCGLLFSAGLNAKERTEELQLQETADLLAGNVFFLLLGAALPWRLWFAELDWWRLVLLAVSVYTTKRLPVVIASYRLLPLNLRSFAEAAHMGWFGPSGAASFLYALEILSRMGKEDTSDARKAYLVVTWLVLVSVFLHGSTGVPVTRWMAKGMVRDLSDPEEQQAEFETWDIQDWQNAAERGDQPQEQHPAPQAPPSPGKLIVQALPIQPLRRFAQRRQQPEQGQESGQDAVLAQEQQAQQQALEVEPARTSCERQPRQGLLHRLGEWLRKWMWVVASQDNASAWITKREQRVIKSAAQVTGASRS